MISASIVLLVVVVCIGLADWQWQRAKQKQQRLDNIQSMQEKGLLDWAGLTSLPETLNKTGLRLQLKGTVRGKKYWLLDNRTLQGQPGYDVLALFYPTGSVRALLVNFGWVAQGISRNKLPQVQFPAQELTLSVQLKEGDLSGFYLSGAEQAGAGWPKRIQFIDLEQQAQQSNAQLVDFMAYVIDLQGFAQPHYKPVVMPPEKHRAYAFQWLLIALAAATIFIFAIRSQSKVGKDL